MAKLDAVIETYPLPSYWWPKAFISRARLDRKYDVVMGKNARYPISIIAVGKNPLQARLMLEKRLRNTTQIPRKNEYLMHEGVSKTTKDLAHLDSMERILSGRDPMTPTLDNQITWAQHLSPDIEARFTAAGDHDVWRILSIFTKPLLDSYGSSAHQKGISILQLFGEHVPTLADVDAKLYDQSGWHLQPVSGETEPRLFFSLLAQKIFPVATHTRPLHAVFCGFEPDYWHELIGHAALLTDQKFSDLYQWCGIIATQMCLDPQPKVAPADLFKVLLMLLEYGIMKDHRGESRAFGGALSSSYMALQRLKLGFIKTVPFNPSWILKNWFADGFPVRRRQNAIELFHITSLDEAKQSIADWACLHH